MSTAYTWSDAQESLTVNTRKGTYEMKQLDSITFKSKPATLLGVPLENKAFVDAVEGKKATIVQGLEDIVDTYSLLDYIAEHR